MSSGRTAVYQSDLLCEYRLLMSERICTGSGAAPLGPHHIQDKSALVSVAVWDAARAGRNWTAGRGERDNAAPLLLLLSLLRRQPPGPTGLITH